MEDKRTEKGPVSCESFEVLRHRSAAGASLWMTRTHFGESVHSAAHVEWMCAEHLSTAHQGCGRGCESWDPSHVIAAYLVLLADHGIEPDFDPGAVIAEQEAQRDA